MGVADVVETPLVDHDDRPRTADRIVAAEVGRRPAGHDVDTAICPTLDERAVGRAVVHVSQRISDVVEAPLIDADRGTLAADAGPAAHVERSAAGDHVDTIRRRTVDQCAVRRYGSKRGELCRSEHGHGLCPSKGGPRADVQRGPTCNAVDLGGARQLDERAVGDSPTARGPEPKRPPGCRIERERNLMCTDDFVVAPVRVHHIERVAAGATHDDECVQRRDHRRVLELHYVTLHESVEIPDLSAVGGKVGESTVAAADILRMA